MIRHIVLLKFKDDASEEKIRALVEANKAMPGQIPEVVSAESGTDLGLSQGGFDYGVAVDFASKADYQAYLAHPVHMALGALAVELLADMAQIQFEY